MVQILLMLHILHPTLNPENTLFLRKSSSTKSKYSPQFLLKWLLRLFALFYFSAPYYQSQANAQSESSCTDDAPLCGFWAKKGECRANPRWMLGNCKVSCGTCEIGPADAKFKREFSSAPSKPRVFQIPTECSTIQTVEIPTRIVPTGPQYRNKAFRMGCAVPNQPNICAQNTCYHERYRTIDGSCNNLEQSLVGAAYTPYLRLLPAQYEDGMDRMVGTTPGSMPNPRDVTHLLLSTKIAIPTKFNALLMQYGQFLSHDITRNTIINTCSCSTIAPQCANMEIPPHDAKTGQCIPMTRSIPLCGTGTTGGRTPRTPVNENTQYIDASQIYASDPKTARELRAGALIRTSAVRGMVFPPPDANKDNIVTGDLRANLFIGLAAFHTIFVRLHNRIVLSLLRLNPRWGEDQVYQEARKIVGAICQVITYQEFLPALLGTENLNQLIPPYEGYKPNERPEISIEFASAAYRMHGLIREFYRLVDKNYHTVGSIRFVEGAGSVRRLLNSGTDLLIRGMMTVASKRPQRLTSQVTEELFSVSDMGSLNINRGRDHGLKPYMAYRKLCGLREFHDFNDWEEVRSIEVRRRVSELYKSPDKIDLYAGALVEDPLGDSLLGPTFSCILAEQFRRSRDADRFFYLNPSVFTRPQVAALQKVTLALILCETGEGFEKVPKNAFVVDDGTKALFCDSPEIPKFDLRPWADVEPF